MENITVARPTLRKVYPGERAFEKRRVFVEIENNSIALRHVEAGDLTRANPEYMILSNRKLLLDDVKRLATNPAVLNKVGEESASSCIVM